MKDNKKAWINGIFMVITLVINGLGAAGFINGMSQKEISDKYLTLITPAPSTFSIWSLIYSLLIISMIVMIVKKDELYYQRAVEEISALFRVSCVFNMAWIVSFSYEQIGLSVLFIFAFLITLTLIGQKLSSFHTGRNRLLPLTFGLYSGWLFIATVVNVAAWLVKLQWKGFGFADSFWAVLVLIISVVLAAMVLLRLRNAIFPLPIAWAYLGIYQFLAAPEGFGGDYLLLKLVALAGMVVLIGIAAIRFYLNKYSLLPENQTRWRKDATLVQGIIR